MGLDWNYEEIFFAALFVLSQIETSLGMQNDLEGFNALFQALQSNNIGLIDSLM